MPSLSSVRVDAFCTHKKKNNVHTLLLDKSHKSSLVYSIKQMIVARAVDLLAWVAVIMWSLHHDSH